MCRRESFREGRGVRVIVSESPAVDVSALGFLVGNWRGTGDWGGRPFVCRTSIAWLLGRRLQIDVAAEQDGSALHRERVVVHSAGDRLEALLVPERGEAQRFDVQVLDLGAAYRLVFTPPAGSALSPQRWTIRRTATGYEELFEVAPGGGAFQPSVVCAYVPDAALPDDAVPDEALPNNAVADDAP